MKNTFLFVAFICSLYFLVTSCNGQSNLDKGNISDIQRESHQDLNGGSKSEITQAIVGLEVPKSDNPHPVKSDTKAIKIANELLKSLNATWGNPTGVQRTVSNWYRVEYGIDDRGVERIILVNSETGDASFPLPR